MLDYKETDSEWYMRTDRTFQVKQKSLSLSIKRACLALGCVGCMAGLSVNAANPIVRSSSHAFAIPDEVVENIIVGPSITTIDDKKYLQFVAWKSPDSDFVFYQNIIVGPIERLFDRTTPWDDLIYSSQTFLFNHLSVSNNLVDLDSDGVNTLVYGVDEYDINNTPARVSTDIFDGQVPYGITGPMDFVDADGDGDLDVFMSSRKLYQINEYYENTGTPEVPVFVLDHGNIEHTVDQYYQTLPAGFVSYFNSHFSQSFPSEYQFPLVYDFDSDGDLDLLMAGDDVRALRYYEQSSKDGTPIYSEPFDLFPVKDSNAYWVTDFDTDGDLDLLVNSVPGEIQFYKRINSNPIRYASPVTITNFPQWSGVSSIGAPDSYSVLTSSEIFADVNNDGYQDMLVTQVTDSQEFRLLLLIKQEDNNAFNQLLVYQGNDIDFRLYYDVKLIDVNNDGMVDVALQFSDEFTHEKQSVLLFEQYYRLTFSAPIELAADAVVFKPSSDNNLKIDIDGDGDIDTVNNRGVTWNLDSSPGSVMNFSTRSYVGEGSDILIGGFIIEGQSPQTVILRGIGPSLAEKGVKSPLQDPHIYLFSGDRLIAHNDDWQAAKDAGKIESAGIGLEHPKESGLRVRLDPGVYTVHLKGKPGDTGVGIIGVDADNQMPTNSLQVNISGRAFVDEGEAITIGGFVIEGDTPVKVLIRGLGPQLRNKGVSNALGDPNITLFSGSTVIANNNDWKNGAHASEIAELDIAPEHDREAAILRELAPGTYTVHLRGATGNAGVGIIAVDRL